MKLDKLGTLPFSELLKRTPDTFEAVTVLGLRSRQITNRRVAERLLLEQDMIEDEIDDLFEPREQNEDYVEAEKELLLAVRNFFEDDLKWDFRPLDDDPAEDELGESTDV